MKDKDSSILATEKGARNSSSDYNTDQEKLKSPSNSKKGISLFNKINIGILLLSTLIGLFILYGDYYRYDYFYNFSDNFWWGDRSLVYLTPVVCFLVLFLINHILKTSQGIRNYIKSRPKNTALFILSVCISKILIHFFIYPSIINNGGVRGGYYSVGEKPYREFEAPLSYHINNVFFDEVWLFIPTIILLSFTIWYFSGKIKAR